MKRMFHQRIVTDRVMARVDVKPTGIAWNPSAKIEDLEFAYDFMPPKRTETQDLQTKIDELRKISKEVGLSKTKILTKSQNCRKIKINEDELGDSDKMWYLGSVIEIKGGKKKHIERRINQARNSFNTVRKIWSSNAITFIT